MKSHTAHRLAMIWATLLIIACGDRTPNDTGAAFSPHSPSSGANTNLPQIYIYSPGIHFGGFGGRTSADGLCKSAIPAVLDSVGFEAHALLNFSSTDTIATLYTSQGIPNKTIYGYGSDIVIANNWTDLLSGNLQASMATAGILPTNTIYWTGFNADGAMAQDNCNGFTDSTLNYSGQIGNSDYADGRWAGYQADACNTKYYYLCVAFTQ